MECWRVHDFPQCLLHPDTSCLLTINSAPRNVSFVSAPTNLSPHPQVMYGGRAIDSFDRRILTVYMDEYLGDFIFDTFQPFHFFHNDEVDYRIPPDGFKETYVGVLQSLSGNVVFINL